MKERTRLLTSDEIMRILNKEIEWCNENPDSAFHAEYRKGFINGLIQAKYLISEASKKRKSFGLRVVKGKELNE